MLKDKPAMATIAVKDMTIARKFYEGTLGLERSENGSDDAVVYKSGDSRVLVYVSQYAGTNQATAASWEVGDGLDEIVKDLKGKGVRFEHYDLPETRREGDIHHAGPTRVAWLKDPDGNILSLFSENRV
ncbi:MAG TPA: VOC family protein [Thermoanaerobaculia bacterium]|nr:VOC family protein [Thermoanaerobaculia bacterium]